MRLALLLLGVCPLLYNYSDYSENNGVFQGYKGYQGISCQSSGHVSLFHLPTRHESGSYAQISNDARGNSVFNFPYFPYFPYFSFQKLKVHIDERFDHVFSLIGLTGAVMAS